MATIISVGNSDPDLENPANWGGVVPTVDDDVRLVNGDFTDYPSGSLYCKSLVFDGGRSNIYSGNYYVVGYVDASNMAGADFAPDYLSAANITVNADTVDGNCDIAGEADITMTGSNDFTGNFTATVVNIIGSSSGNITANQINVSDYVTYGYYVGSGDNPLLIATYINNVADFAINVSATEIFSGTFEDGWTVTTGAIDAGNYLGETVLDGGYSYNSGTVVLYNSGGPTYIKSLTINTDVNNFQIENSGFPLEIRSLAWGSNMLVNGPLIATAGNPNVIQAVGGEFTVPDPADVRNSTVYGASGSAASDDGTLAGTLAITTGDEHMEYFPDGGALTSAITVTSSEVDALDIAPTKVGESINVTVVAPGSNTSAINLVVYGRLTPNAPRDAIFTAAGTNGHGILAVAAGETRTFTIPTLLGYEQCTSFVVTLQLANPAGAATAQLQATA